MFEFLSDREKLIFLSGIFEGEGCFGHFKNGKKPKRIEIQLQMTDPDVVNKFYQYFKKGHLTKKEYTNHYKTMYRWKVTGLEALKILHKILNYKTTLLKTGIFSAIIACWGVIIFGTFLTFK